MNDKVPQHEHLMREHKRDEDISELSDRLAPPEETGANSGIDLSSRKDDGTLVVDTGALKLPPGFVESEEDKRGIFGFEPVIVFILTLLIAFIAVIAYLVYRMPAPVK
jgi:hypothetical protein